MTAASTPLGIAELTLADSVEMAQVHSIAFPREQAWGTPQIEDLLRQASVRARAIKQQGQIQSFLLFQTAADQAEILTLATAPSARRRGLAAALLADTESDLGGDGISTWLLDVAEDNSGAIAFYRTLGFKADGRRAKYYKRAAGIRVDAILMSKPMARQATT